MSQNRDDAPHGELGAGILDRDSARVRLVPQTFERLRELRLFGE